MTAERYTLQMDTTLLKATAARLEGLSIPVADVERSQAFYTRLGFTTEYQAGKTFALLRIEGGTLRLLRAKVEAGAAFRDSVHIELTTDDLDGLYATFQSSGTEVEMPPHDRAWERAMVLRDPDGFRVEFAQGLRGHNRTD